MIFSYKKIFYIFLLSFSLGILRNLLLEEPLSLIKKKRQIKTIKLIEDSSIQFELPENMTEPHNVTIKVVEHLRRKDIATIIDARDEEDFKNGHIKDAINIPYDYYEDFEFLLDEVDLERIIIIYCSGGECSLSLDLADYLMQERGFFNVLIYEGGWPEWKESGYEIE